MAQFHKNKRILVINGHPSKNSFCAAITKVYIEGINLKKHEDYAEFEGHELRQINISDLKFDPILHDGYNSNQELEEDLKIAQDLIKWADHTVWIFPTWWGGLPALTKGFIDRVFLPKFAFKYRHNSFLWDKYLKGKTAHLIVTYGGPEFGNRFILGNPIIKMMRCNFLWFCGVKVKKITYIGGLRLMSKEKRNNWLKKVSKIAQKY